MPFRFLAADYTTAESFRPSTAPPSHSSKISCHIPIVVLPVSLVLEWLFIFLSGPVSASPTPAYTSGDESSDLTHGWLVGWYGERVGQGAGIH